MPTHTAIEQFAPVLWFKARGGQVRKKPLVFSAVQRGAWGLRVTLWLQTLRAEPSIAKRRLHTPIRFKCSFLAFVGCWMNLNSHWTQANSSFVPCIWIDFCNDFGTDIVSEGNGQGKHIVIKTRLALPTHRSMQTP